MEERKAIIKHLFMVRDNLAGAFNPQIIMASEDADTYKELLIRSILKADETTLLNIKDNTYFYIGTFNDITGKLDLLENYDKLFDACDYIKKEN